MGHLMKSSLFCPFFLVESLFHIFCGILFFWISILLFFFGGNFFTPIHFAQVYGDVKSARQTDERSVFAWIAAFFWSPMTMTPSDPIYSFNTNTDTFICHTTIMNILNAAQLIHGLPYAHGNNIIYPAAEIYMVLCIVFRLFPNHKILFHF